MSRKLENVGLMDRDTMTKIADAIREKTGSNENQLYKPTEMPAAIRSIDQSGLQPTGTYEILDNGMYDISEYQYVDVHVGTRPGQIPLWGDPNATNAEILNALNRDRNGEIDLSEYWAVGDERKIQLNSITSESMEDHDVQEITLVLMDANCDGFEYTYSVPSGRTKPRFMVGVKEILCMSTGQWEPGKMNTTASNKNGWGECKRRSWCNTDFYNALPQEVKAFFVPFTWTLGKGGIGVTDLVEYNDIIGLAPIKCVCGGGGGFSLPEEDNLYNWWDYYKTVGNRIKSDSISGRVYWMSSPSRVENKSFCVCNGSGNNDAKEANLDYGISPFGCI